MAALLTICAVTGQQPTFTDWDRRQSCTPSAIVQPSSTEEVVAIVKKSQGQQIKTFGAGHSFSACALTDPIGTFATVPIMLNLDRMARVLEPPSLERPIIRVQAGIRIHQLNEYLHSVGYALANAGAIAEQSIAGATATSTHGTGRKLGSMSTQLASITLVLANASVVEASASAHPDLFDAARASIGALGVVVEVGLQVVPRFKLRRTETAWDLDELLTALPSLHARFERLQWYWTPLTSEATLLVREPVPPDTPITGCWTERGARAAALGGRRARASCVDWSYKALSHPSAFDYTRALYTEMEMFVPTAQDLALVAELRAFHETVRPALEASCPAPACTLFAGVRYVAADDIWLSMSHGRATAVLSQIVTGPSANESGPAGVVELLDRGLERLGANHSGRPHWGKWHESTADYLETVYPRLGAFGELRRQLDPEGLFLNAWLRSQLGVGLGRTR